MHFYHQPNSTWEILQLIKTQLSWSDLTSQLTQYHVVHYITSIRVHHIVYFKVYAYQIYLVGLFQALRNVDFEIREVKLYENR